MLNEGTDGSAFCIRSVIFFVRFRIIIYGLGDLGKERLRFVGRAVFLSV